MVIGFEDLGCVAFLLDNHLEQLSGKTCKIWRPVLIPGIFGEGKRLSSLCYFSFNLSLG